MNLGFGHSPDKPRSVKLDVFKSSVGELIFNPDSPAVANSPEVRRPVRRCPSRESEIWGDLQKTSSRLGMGPNHENASDEVGYAAHRRVVPPAQVSQTKEILANAYSHTTDNSRPHTSRGRSQVATNILEHSSLDFTSVNLGMRPATARASGSDMYHVPRVDRGNQPPDSMGSILKDAEINEGSIRKVLGNVGRYSQKGYWENRARRQPDESNREREMPKRTWLMPQTPNPISWQ